MVEIILKQPQLVICRKDGHCMRGAWLLNEKKTV